MSEHEVELTSEERDGMILALFEPDHDCVHNMRPLYDAIEAIIAARLADAEARAEAAKKAIVEALDGWFGHHEPCDGGCDLTDAHLCDVASFLTPRLREALRGDQ